MTPVGSYPKAFISAAIVGFAAIVVVAGTGQKDLGRGALVFGSEAIASGVIVAACMRLSRMSWPWPLAALAVFGVFLLLAAAVPTLIFRK
jgi:hypothetical protein